MDAKINTKCMLSGWILIMLLPLVSAAQLTWNKYEEQVLWGEPGDWDRNCWSPVVIYEDGIFKMWYNGAVWENERQIGFATSEDGILWVKDENNPVITGGASGFWDHHRYPGTVLRVNDTLRMWYSGSSDSFSDFSIGYAWSVEDNEWNLFPDPILEKGASGTWEDFGVAFPCVYYDGSTYHMYYSGARVEDDALLNEIGYATSTDGRNWTRYEENPVIERGFEGTFYDVWAASSGLVVYKDTLHMFFNGFDGTTYSPDLSFFRAGYAWSTDFVTWHIGNDYWPAVDVGPAGSWDDREIRQPYVIVQNGRLKMWYAGLRFYSSFKIGYALGDTVTDTGVGLPDECAETPKLLHVSPNPFTLDATITFRMTERSPARIELLNGCGQVITVPLDGIKDPGLQKVTLTSRELPAGVYFCVLKTNDGVQTKKIIKL